APQVVSVNPPPLATVVLPLGQITLTFDQDMFDGGPEDPASVTNRANYVLQGDVFGTIPLTQIVYDTATRTAVLNFDALGPDTYE
ncbi:MAG: hypothetical protein GTO03_09430, partial [Planctomycetales bacterium]|nr:hypothetical protein [Planctomycetales bacterium]